VDRSLLRGGQEPHEQSQGGSVNDLLLDIRGLRKSYGTQEVLKGVDLSIAPGQRMALLGSNGAGKSTLVKIIAGDVQDWEGQILFEGRPHRPNSPAEALARGITLMYQELETLPDLTVAENIVLGGRDVRSPFFRRRKALEFAGRALERVGGADIPPDIRAGELPPAAQQLVMLARAVAHESKLLILDEPTALLTEPEIDRLFTILDGFTEAGTAILYISHRIQELFRLGGRIAVLRDGVLAGIVEPDPDKVPEIVRLMSGRTLEGVSRPREPAGGGPREPVLEVRGLRTPVVHDVSFFACRGEILGIAGLVGSGRSELLRAVAGLDPREGGEVLVRGRPLPPEDPKAALQAGLVLTPEDRKDEGLFQDFDLARNVVMPRIDECARHGFIITESAERVRARPMLDATGVAPPEPDRPASSLSGGNQQKLLLARALFAGAEVLLLDEPTRGIDVAAKEEVFQLMRRLADEGKAVVFVSSELEEVARVADRIIVLHEGRLVGELGAGASEEDILHAIFAGAARGEPAAVEAAETSPDASQ